MQTVQIPGFESQQIAVEMPGAFGSAKLFVNGQPAPPAPKKGQYLLRQNDGTEVVASFKSGWPDPTPMLVVGAQTIKLAEPLMWYQWIWAAWPLVLILLGGAIGGLLGGGAAVINTQIFRSDKNAFVKYALTAFISVIAFVLWLIVASMAQSAIKGKV